MNIVVLFCFLKCLVMKLGGLGSFFVAVLSRGRLKKYVAVFETKQEQ